MAKAFLAAVMAVAVFGLWGCSKASSGQAPLSTSAIAEAVKSGKKTFVFFINPEGAPCRAQNDILVRLHGDMAQSFNIAYVNSLKEEDGRAFSDYGVRGLPSVVLLDGKGAIAKRFPPGIQPYGTLAEALKGAK